MRSRTSPTRGALLAALLAACAGEETSSSPPLPRACREGLSSPGPGAASLLRDPHAPFELPPLQTEVPLYELEVPPAALSALDRAPDEDTMYPATFVFEGQRHPVSIRYRGNSSRTWPKKSWRVEFLDGVGIDGRHKLNLLSQWKDCTMMVEKLGYDLLAALQVPAPTATFVRLRVNGAYRGVHLDLERVDRRFLKAHRFPDDDATIYRCGRKDCEFKLWRAEFQKPWEKKTNEHENDAALIGFLRGLHVAPEPELPEALDELLELELYLRTVVVDALISNDVVEDSRSYLILDAVNGRWHYVPWDLNNSSTRFQPGSRVGTEARVDHPLFPYSVFDSWSEQAYQERRKEDPARDWHPLFSDLTTRIAAHAELRERLLDRLDCALETVFAEPAIFARIDAIEALLAPWIPGDEHVFPEKFDDGPRYLKDYVVRRTAFLREELARWRGAAPGVVLERVDPAAGLVELKNRGPEPVSLRGWTLTGDLRRRPRPNLSGTLAPGETLAVDAAELGLELAPGGELGLWSGRALDDVADLLFLGDGGPVARDPGDPARWVRAP